MPIFKQKNENFFKKWSPEMAYVLGFFTADGSMIKNKKGAHFIDFYSNDKDILEKIKYTASLEHKITHVIRKSVKWNDSYKLQIGSREWYKDLQNFGLTQNKSRVVRMPKIPTEYLPHFVRGYFDGDGNVHMGRYWRKDRKNWKWQFSVSFVSGSRLFLEDLWISLKRYVNGGHINIKNREYGLVFSKLDSIALFKFMYHNVPTKLFLERKYITFQKALKKFKYAVVA